VKNVLETRGLTKHFGAFTAVSDVSISFEEGLIHAVLGENGAGKSTLMKLLFGLHQPSSGTILLDGEPVAWRTSMDAIRRGLGMVQQHFSLVEPLSAIDNIMLGAEVCGAIGRLDRKAAIARLEKLLPSEHLSVPWETPVGQLSVGQKQRVEILKLLFREARVLFLDEPTAVLTPAEIDEFFEVLRKLKAAGCTIVIITHKINEVIQVCDRYSVLRQGKLVAQGKVEGTSVESIVESMIGRKLPEFTLEREAPRAETVLETMSLSEAALSSQSEASLQRGQMNGLSLRVHAGEIVGVAGVEGSGQSSFVDAVMGLKDFDGELKILGEKLLPRQTARVRELGTGLVPEDRHHQGLWLTESCFTNMIIGLEDRFLKNHVFQNDRIQSETLQWAKEFDVRTASLENPVGSLSGGNQQKVIFAREVNGRKPRFLICHQPTRGVDLGAIDLIHRKIVELRNQGLGVLVLSSELDELLKLCDRIYVFFEGRISAEFARHQFDRCEIGAAMTGAVLNHAAMTGADHAH
jgi:simple sugar transport system ATP-binding protein